MCLKPPLVKSASNAKALSIPWARMKAKLVRSTNLPAGLCAGHVPELCRGGHGRGAPRLHLGLGQADRPDGRIDEDPPPPRLFLIGPQLRVDVDEAVGVDTDARRLEIKAVGVRLPVSRDQEPLGPQDPAHVRQIDLHFLGSESFRSGPYRRPGQRQSSGPETLAPSKMTARMTA